MWARRREQLGWVVLFRASDLVVVKVSAAASVLRRLDGAGGAAPGLPRAVAGGLVPPRTE